MSQKRLIKKGADVNAVDGNGDTALMYAAAHGRAKLVEFLIEKGADVNAVDKDGMTALMYAQTAEQTELLIEKGANVNAKDYEGRTALELAQTDEQIALIKAAMQKEAEKEAKKRDLEKRRELHRRAGKVLKTLKGKHPDEKVSDSTRPNKTAKVDKKRTITPKNEGRD